MRFQKDFSLKVKSLDDQQGTFTAYASVWGGPDLVGDHVMQGAWTKSINASGGLVPLLWNHSTSEPLGIAKVSENSTGLLAECKLVMEDPLSRKVLAHLRMGSIKAMSVGFSLPSEASGKVSVNADGSRIIREARLWEVSLTSLPAQPLALVDQNSIKSLQQADQLLRSIRSGDVDAETLASLRSINGAVKSLLTKDGGCLCECDACPDNCDDCTDGCDLCDGDTCSGCVAARADAAELAATTDAVKSLVSSLRMELKRIL